MSAFNLPNGTPISSLPNANGVPYLTVHDDQNKHTVPSGQYWKKETSVDSGVYIWVPTSENDKLPVKVSELEDKIDDLNTKIDDLNTKIDNIVNGSTPATTQLMGSAVNIASTAKQDEAKAVLDLLNSKLEVVRALLAGTLSTQLTGSNVVIGGATYQVSSGDTLRNTSANRPTATAAHAVIPFCYYFAVDTMVVSVTDGTTWRDV